MYSILNPDASDLKPSFWQRQFSVPSTLPQTTFDVVFGIVMPVICFYLDPGIVQGPLSYYLPGASVFIYPFSFLAILTLALWLVFGRRVKSSSGVFGGILLSGAICSFIIGVAILPLTLIAIFWLIGLLGFVPLLTAFVYLRNGVRAVNRGNSLLRKTPLAASIILSALLVTGLPAFARWKVTRIIAQSMNEMVSENASDAEAAIERVRYFRPLIDKDSIARRYELESDKGRKERLARAYKQITGEDIETRLAILND